jgi:hypothetical protein
LIAAPGTPNAQTTPSLSRILTAASIARIFAMSRLLGLPMCKLGSTVRVISIECCQLSHDVAGLQKSVALSTA